MSERGDRPQSEAVGGRMRAAASRRSRTCPASRTQDMSRLGTMFRMRIIAGTRKGHRIDAPKGTATRPTSDRVRENVFNLVAPWVEDAVVLDLFAGSGAMGLEALSRGAERAVFVEVRQRRLPHDQPEPRQAPPDRRAGRPPRRRPLPRHGDAHVRPHLLRPALHGVRGARAAARPLRPEPARRRRPPRAGDERQGRSRAAPDAAH